LWCGACAECADGSREEPRSLRGAERERSTQMALPRPKPAPKEVAEGARSTAARRSAWMRPHSPRALDSPAMAPARTDDASPKNAPANSSCGACAGNGGGGGGECGECGDGGCGDGWPTRRGAAIPEAASPSTRIGEGGTAPPAKVLGAWVTTAAGRGRLLGLGCSFACCCCCCADGPSSRLAKADMALDCDDAAAAPAMPASSKEFRKDRGAADKDGDRAPPR